MIVNIMMKMLVSVVVNIGGTFMDGIVDDGFYVNSFTFHSRIFAVIIASISTH